MSKSQDFQHSIQHGGTPTPQRAPSGMAPNNAPHVQAPGPYQQAMVPHQHPVQPGFQAQPIQAPQQPWPPRAQAPSWNGFTPQVPGHSTPLVKEQATHVGQLPQPPQQARTHNTLSQAPKAFVDVDNALEVRLLWGDTVLDHAHYRAGAKSITVGESRQNTFTLSSDALPQQEDSFTLVEICDKEGVMYVHFTDAMQGWLSHNGHQETFARLETQGYATKTDTGHKFVLPEKARVSMQVGSLMFEIAVVPLPSRLGVVAGMQMDHKLSRALGASFLLHGLVIIFMLFADETPKNLDETFLKQDDRFSGLILRPKEPEKALVAKKRAGGGKAHKKEGKIGSRTSTKKNRRADQIKKNPEGTSPIDLKKTLNKKQLLNSIMRKGFLGLLPGGKQSAGSILNAKGLGGGDVNALGSWRGAKSGDAAGGGGLGLIDGGGPGGGGLMGNSVATGSPGLFGRGKGKGGRNWQSGKLRKRTKHQVKITLCVKCMTARGGLDRKIIRRHINMYRKHIKYCYERELIKNKRLSGKIEIKFTIQANGRVRNAAVARSSMNNDRVESCIRHRVTMIRFPAPIGGGIVVVRYPFMFRSGGQ